MWQGQAILQQYQIRIRHIFPPHQLKSQDSFLILLAISRPYLIPIPLSMNSNLLLIQASLSLPLFELALATSKGQRSKNPASGILFPSNANVPAKSISPNIKGAVAQTPEIMSSMIYSKRVSRFSSRYRLFSFEDRSLAPE